MTMTTTIADDTITISSLSCQLPNGLGPSAFGLTPPPPCPVSITLILHLHPAVIPLCVSDDSFSGLGVNYSSVSKAVYAVVSDPTRTWRTSEEVLEAIAGVPLLLESVASVEVTVELPRALLHAQSVVYGATFGAGEVRSLKMEIRDLRVSCIIGLHPHERKEKQRLEVDLVIEPYKSTMDHKALADAALEYLESSSAGTLESLIDSLARHLLPLLSDTTRLGITIRKPSALPYATPSISITRTSASASSSNALAGPSRFGREQTGEGKSDRERIFIALGSNMGDRVDNIRRAVRELEGQGVKVIRTGRMYESEPMYVEDQARFVNSVIEVSTPLAPLELLKVLKRTERSTGRTKTFTNGPRVVDLDLLYYGSQKLMVGNVGDAEDADGVGWLELPHPRVAEREFVLRPLNDIAPTFVDPTNRLPISLLLARHTTSSLAPIIPLSPNPIRLTSKPLIMGIFNATPDSFSDGHTSRTETSSALSQIKDLMSSPCPPDFLDIGGMSTRPNSIPCSEEEEIARVVPLIQAIRALDSPWANSIPISVDTYRSNVAKLAVQAGASIINDVRGGREAGMLEVMAECGVPVVLMHSRGDSSSMTSKEMTDYGSSGVIAGVQSELAEVVRKARQAGVKEWDIILDPGIGFAKSHDDNLALLRGLPHFTGGGAGEGGGELARYPLLVGASRKGFVGKVIGRSGKEEADQRGWGDAVVNAWCTLFGGKSHGGVAVLRVHDVRGAKESVRMAEALRG